MALQHGADNLIEVADDETDVGFDRGEEIGGPADEVEGEFSDPAHRLVEIIDDDPLAYVWIACD